MIRRALRCRGTLQGVGFRPAVYRLATDIGLRGHVRNDPDGASIEIEGSREAVERFLERLPDSLPPLARLDGVEFTEPSRSGASEFCVEESEVATRRRAIIPADAALCQDCRSEIEDPNDRRHRYPFTTCTNCGPRFSLTSGLPYDRARTSMAQFPLCRDCDDEYHDPTDRRFHAEPLCCPRCGPKVWLEGSEGKSLAEGPASLGAAREALARGEIVAVKGLGGFQLACRSDDDAAISRLRALKQRPTRPFAVMVADVETAREIVSLDARDEAALSSHRAPILLAPARGHASIGATIAPGVADVGVMLPTTPLHVELFRDTPYRALVMTSGNAFDEPIAHRNDEARARLARFADVFLLHDREIVRRVDDSVVRTTRDGPAVVRRSRGFAPESVPLPGRCTEPVLALGAHLQTTACVGVEDDAFPSQHVGDLDTEPAREFLAEVAHGLEAFLEVEARVIAVDLHPDLPSTWLGERLASERGGRLVRVQHHLAHAAGVLAEHGLWPAAEQEAAALIFDGTGHGPDGTSWGGEWLAIHGDLRWRRLASTEPMPLVGGEAAIREPWRVAVAALARHAEDELLRKIWDGMGVPAAKIEAIRALALGDEWPLASGAGRIFEAAGALLGLGPANHWEGECAARLEALAEQSSSRIPAWPEVALPPRSHELPSSALLVAAARRIAAGESPADIARGFHVTFCALAAELSARVLPSRSAALALGGGCLVNRILRQELTRAHQALGIEVRLPFALPAGDGGLSYGQTVVACASLASDRVPEFEGGP